MKTKETIYPPKVTFFGIDRILWYSNGYQKSTKNFRKRLRNIISRFVNGLVNRFVGSGNSHMIGFKTHSATRPISPVKISCPGQLQSVAKKQTQSVHLLPKLPVRQIRIAPKLVQPLLNIYRVPVNQTNIRRIVDKGFNMPAIPGKRFNWNTEKLQGFEIAFPKLTYSSIFRRNRGFRRQLCSLLENSFSENIMRTKCSISQYSCVQHMSIFARVT